MICLSFFYVKFPFCYKCSADIPLSLFTFAYTHVTDNLHNEIISGNKYEGKGGSSCSADR